MEARCTAGQLDEPTDCERHPHHYWCEWCEGWYGVPHHGLCHTALARRTTRKFVRPQPTCACRFCQWVDKLGYEFTIQAVRGDAKKGPTERPG